jgi:hypothetical protein
MTSAMTHNGAVGLSVRGVVCEIVGSFAASQAGGPLRRLRLLFSVPVTHPPPLRSFVAADLHRERRCDHWGLAGSG